MITIYTEESTTISQKSYDDIIAAVNIRELKCICGKCGCLIRHGSYKRTIKVPGGELLLRVSRVKCSDCGCTHALFISSIIPYSQICLKDQTLIINCFEDKSGYDEIFKSNQSFDENDVRSVILRYRRYWREYVLSSGISLFPLKSLVKSCFTIFRKQFMQIKDTKNVLYLFPT